MRATFGSGGSAAAAISASAGAGGEAPGAAGSAAAFSSLDEETDCLRSTWTPAAPDACASRLVRRSLAAFANDDAADMPKPAATKIIQKKVGCRTP